jgi:transcriptional regulator with XRE-family HTH domain
MAPKTLGETLADARQKAGMSLRQVEAVTGIHNAHLSQIEKGGITKPDMAMLWELASLYGIDYSRLLRLAGYTSGAPSSGRERQRITVALRAMGDLSPKDQDDVLQYMADLKRRRSSG